MMYSVIIPTYKPEAYIKDCLNSLNRQTLSKYLFEVIVVLNGPKGPYFEDLLECITLLDLDIKLYYIAEAGVSIARNHAIEKAKGEYICFVDDDDILSDNYLYCLQDKVSGNSIVVANVYSFKDSIDKTTRDYLSFSSVCDGFNLITNRRYLSTVCCKLIPRNCIGNQRFKVDMSDGEDAAFIFSISNKIDGIRFADHTCIYYRRLRSGSLSRKQKSIPQRIKVVFTQQKEYSRIYFSNLKEYSFLFYTSRMLASLKGYFI